MKKIILLMFVLLSSLSFCLAHNEDKSHYVYLQDPNDLINPNGFYEYMIIKNDHLSHLAYKFYRDGLKWPKIYKTNPYIIDPNWIYPDNWLVIPDIYFDENGSPITKERTFTYKSNDLVIIDLATKSRIAKENILYQNDKSGNSQVHANIGKNFNKTILFKSETQGAESDSEINEQLENNIEDTTEIKPEPSLAITNGNIPKTGSISHSDENRKSIKYKKTSAYKNANWIFGLHGGYPLGDVPDEEDNLALGLLVGTPLRITLGPLSARLGVGLLVYDFTGKLYPGAGVLLNLVISELLKLSTPIQLQVHGTGFYVPEGSVGKGILGSVSTPLGDSPFNIGIYVGAGDYDNNGSEKSSWINTGLLLQLQL